MTPGHGAPSPDLVVYAAGGGMRGIFGAGALHVLVGMGPRGTAPGPCREGLPGEIL